MDKVLWISRHDPTPAQLDEIDKHNQVIVDVDKGKKLGSMNLESKEDINGMVTAMMNLAADVEAKAIYGVFAVPVQAAFYQMKIDSVWDSKRCGDSIPVFSAWNVQRSVEGGKPTFEHKQFVQVGELIIPSDKDQVFFEIH